MELKYYKLNSQVMDLEFATKGSACFDLRAFFALGEKIASWDETNAKRWTVPSEDLWLKAQHRYLIPTGFIFDIPLGYSVRIHPRSGAAVTRGLTLINCEGVIDSDYVNPVYLTVYNTTRKKVMISHQERLAQAELIKNSDYDLKIITRRPVMKTQRAGGFGSTGKN